MIGPYHGIYRWSRERLLLRETTLIHIIPPPPTREDRSEESCLPTYEPVLKQGSAADD